MYKFRLSAFTIPIVFSLLALFSTPNTSVLTTTTTTTTTNNTMPAKSISRKVERKVLAVETPEGDGVIVRRSIGSQQLRNLTPFLMLDHFRIGKGAGFPDHPHRGQATVTYMLEGVGQHEDSAGHAGTIETGGVQWMCAGKGIIHAEMPMRTDEGVDPVGLQLWIDLPKQYKMVDPSYQELGPAEIPIAQPETGVRVKVISGTSHGVTSPVRPLGGCWYFHVMLDTKGKKIFQDLPAGWTTFLYIFKGSVLVGDNPIPQPTFHTVVLSNGSDETGVMIDAAEDDTQFILISGEPLDQTVVQHGPFVMTTREEIQRTLMDYSMGVNGFEKAHSWKSEIGKQRRR